MAKDEEKRIMERNRVTVEILTNARRMEVFGRFPQEKKLLKGVAGSLGIAIPVEKGMFDLEQERARIKKEIAKINLDIEKIEKRLHDRKFLSGAPENFVLETKGRLKELQSKKVKLEESLAHALSLT
jgi:valyl-tRNA synthetase